METKLRQCPVCREWFNTTSPVMIEHYKLKHKFATDKAFAIADLVFKAAWHDAISHVTPFPECMQHYTAARVAENQMVGVQRETDPAMRGTINAFIVGPMVEVNNMEWPTI